MSDDVPHVWLVGEDGERLRVNLPEEEPAVGSTFVEVDKHETTRLEEHWRCSHGETFAWYLVRQDLNGLAMSEINIPRTEESRREDAELDGRAPEVTREIDLVRAGRSLRRTLYEHDHPHKQAIMDIANWLCGELGDPGSSWPVRLPVKWQDDE